MVLLVNAAKPAGWLNGTGDGTQTGDKGNAGNGTLQGAPRASRRALRRPPAATTSSPATSTSTTCAR